MALRALGAGLALAGALLLAGAASADAPGGPALYAKTDQVGVVDLFAFDLPGSRVDFFERVGTRSVALGTRTIPAGAAIAGLRRAATWRCGRRARRFTAAVTRSDGTRWTADYAVRTPSCADRLSLTAPRRAARGALAAIAIRDEWRLGDVRPRLCVRAPRGRFACRAVALAGRPAATRHVRLTRAGRWTLELRLGAATEREVVLAGRGRAGGGAARPAVLVTGDSDVQNLDTVLADRLGRAARVVSAWRGGSAIGGPGPYWPGAASRLAARLNPRVTVVSLGGSEGFPIETADGAAACCGAAWRAAYVARVRRMVDAFARGGRGGTLWLTLPVMQDPRRQRIAAAVNAATEAAVAAEPSAALVRIDEVISPGGVFRRTLTRHGHRRVVRQPDGVHLTVAGAEIAADLVAPAARALLRRG